MRRPTLALSLLLALAAPLAAQRPRAATSLALTHVTVIDGTGAPERPDQTVIVQRGRIAAVGPAGRVVVPRGARIVDARGKFLIPGLWDMHVHLRDGDAPLLPVFVAHGVMGVREMGMLMPGVRRFREARAAGTLVAPRILAAGGMIDASIVADILRKASPEVASAELGHRLFVSTPEEGRRAVDSIARSGADFVKFHVNPNRETYFAALDEARRLGIGVTGHAPGGGVGLREIADAGQRSLEHLDLFLDPAWPERTLADSARRALAARVAATGLAFVPTIVVYDALVKFASEPSAAARLARAYREPESRFISPELRAFWREVLPLLGEAVLPREAVDTALAALHALQRGGVRVMPGTDFSVPFLFPGSSLHDEMTLLVHRLGLTPLEAIESATRVPAEFLGMQDSLGTVAPGKIADLVLLDASPLADIENVRRIAAVVWSGRLLDRKALDAMLGR